MKYFWPFKQVLFRILKPFGDLPKTFVQNDRDSRTYKEICGDFRNSAC